MRWKKSQILKNLDNGYHCGCFIADEPTTPRGIICVLSINTDIQNLCKLYIQLYGIYYMSGASQIHPENRR